MKNTLAGILLSGSLMLGCGGTHSPQETIQGINSPAQGIYDFDRGEVTSLHQII